MNWLSLLSVFSGPLGSLANKGIAIGGAWLTAQAVAKGLPMTGVEPIIGSLMMAASSAISMVLGTQTAKIQQVNAADNGVKVVPVNADALQVNRPL